MSLHRAGRTWPARSFLVLVCFVALGTRFAAGECGSAIQSYRMPRSARDSFTSSVHGRGVYSGTGLWMGSCLVIRSVKRVAIFFSPQASGGTQVEEEKSPVLIRLPNSVALLAATALHSPSGT